MPSMTSTGLGFGFEINSFVAQIVADNQLQNSLNANRERGKNPFFIRETFKSALLAVHSALIALDTAADKKAASDAINIFINSYNNFIDVSKRFWNYNAQTCQPAMLSEGALFLKTQGEFSQELTKSLLGNKALNLLDDMGVKIQADDTLSDFVDKFNSSNSSKSKEMKEFFHDNNSDGKSLPTPTNNQLDSINLLDKHGCHTVIKIGKKNNVSDVKTQKNSVHIGAEEARYRKQFNALDSLLSSLRNTNNFLAQQLSHISLQSSASD